MSPTSDHRPFGTISASALSKANREELQRVSEQIAASGVTRIDVEGPAGSMGSLTRQELDRVLGQIAANRGKLVGEWPQGSIGKTLIREPKPGEVVRGTILEMKAAEIPTEIQERLGLPPQAPSQPVPGRARPKKRRPPRGPRRQEIAGRVLARQRKVVMAFFREGELEAELRELATVERELLEGTSRSCKHAAFNGRSLMEGLADRLFPARAEPRKGRDGREHPLGPDDHKNRLIAYVEERLEGRWEGHDFRSFTATMDIVFRWTGSGPHGNYKLEDAEHSYTRMIEALSVIARARRAA